MQREKFDVDLGLCGMLSQIPVGSSCVVPDSSGSLIGYAHVAIRTQFHMESIHSKIHAFQGFEVYGFLLTARAATRVQFLQPRRASVKAGISIDCIMHVQANHVVSFFESMPNPAGVYSSLISIGLVPFDAAKVRV